MWSKSDCGSSRERTEEKVLESKKYKLPTLYLQFSTTVDLVQQVHNELGTNLYWLILTWRNGY